MDAYTRKHVQDGKKLQKWDYVKTAICMLQDVMQRVKHMDYGERNTKRKERRYAKTERKTWKYGAMQGTHQRKCEKDGKIDAKNNKAKRIGQQ